MNKLKDNLTRFVDLDGHICWRNENGQFHHPELPAIEYLSGEKFWYFNGNLSREDGPAVISGDSEEWWLHGKLHRIGGPALILPDKYIWYIENKRYTAEEYIEKLISLGLTKEVESSLWFLA